MKFNIFLFLGQFIIFLSKHELVSGKALIGQNIRKARSGQYSFVVSIMTMSPGHRHSDGNHICTGVMITKKDLLTAAHCLEYEEFNTLRVAVGTIDLRNGSILNPWWWITYDYWITRQNLTIDYEMNDLANMRLLVEVPSRITPVRLSRLSNNELYNADVQTAGWGINNEGITPDIMDVADLKIIENVVCETRMERSIGIRVPILTRILCTYVDPYILVENGDSGGPLMFRNRLIGINHGTCPLDTEASHPVQMNLHMGIDFYRPFINHMKNHQ